MNAVKCEWDFNGVKFVCGEKVHGDKRIHGFSITDHMVKQSWTERSAIEMWLYVSSASNTAPLHFQRLSPRWSPSGREHDMLHLKTVLVPELLRNHLFHHLRQLAHGSHVEVVTIRARSCSDDIPLLTFAILIRTIVAENGSGVQASRLMAEDCVGSYFAAGAEDNGGVI